MPQNPASPTSNGIPLFADGGASTSLNVTAAAVINTVKGRINKIVVSTPGSAGTLTLNDCASIGAATSANTIIAIPFGNLTSGQSINLDLPVTTGIVVSTITTGGVFTLSHIP